MYAGTQVGARSDDDYRVWAQLGIEHICANPPGRPAGWTADHLTRFRKHVESFGLTLDMITLGLETTEVSRAQYTNILLGKSPERGKEIEEVSRTIRACAAAGIPAAKYNLDLTGVISSDPVKGRGGYVTRAFDFVKAKQEPPLTIAGKVDADTYWERITYFLERVVPVASESRVRIACHPHDPGMPRPDGWRGVDRVLGSVDGLKRFVETCPSEYHGLNFCQGTVAEMLERPGRDIYDVIRYFGQRNKIFNVHFRNIRGGFLNFVETFPDEGDVDMLKAMRVYREVGYKYMLMPDHVPHIAGQDPSGVAFAFGYGYIRALIQAVEGER